MTKSELIAKLAVHFPQLVASDAELAVKMILDAMAKSLSQGQRIEIRGSAVSDSITAHRARGAIRNPARRCRCRRSTCRISRPARNCASGSISTVRRNRSRRQPLPCRSPRARRPRLRRPEARGDAAADRRHRWLSRALRRVDPQALLFLLLLGSRSEHRTGGRALLPRT